MDLYQDIRDLPDSHSSHYPILQIMMPDGIYGRDSLRGSRGENKVENCLENQQTLIMIVLSLEAKSQDCGEFHLFNFTDTIVNDWNWNEPKNGFYFDMMYDTLIAENTGYISFYITNEIGDTITIKEYYQWSRWFPYTSADTMRYTMVLNTNLISLPNNFSGYLVTANPECKIPFSIGTTEIQEDLNLKLYLKIYPNPTNGEIFIETKNKEVRIYDITGKLLQAQQNVHSIDITNFNKGVYILRVLLSNGKYISTRIIKY